MILRYKKVAGFCLASLSAASLCMAQPTEADTREAVATLVAQRHDGENGWPLLEEAIEASATAHAEAEAAWARQQRPRDAWGLDDQIHLILKGNWPRDGLAGAEQLVASHGAHKALDISGQQLRYKVMDGDEAGRGYLLYSVGLDGQDDGGTVHEYGPSVAAIGKARPGFDFVFNHSREGAPE